MAEITDLSVTDANNTARFPENMRFRDVNDGGRALEGLLARWFFDWNGSITSSGSSNAYAATSNRTITSLVNNTVIAFTANFTNTGAATFALNGLTAKAIKRMNGDALVSGDIPSGATVMVIYKSSPDVWYMLTSPGIVGDLLASNNLSDVGTAATAFANIKQTATTSATGVAELATDAETITGTDTARVPPVSAVKAAVDARAATQANMEAASSNILFSTPGRQHFHPGHPKASGVIDGSGTAAIVSGDYGLSGLTDNGTGDYTIDLDTAFNDTNFWWTDAVRSYDDSHLVGVSAPDSGEKTESSLQVLTLNVATVSDVDEACLVFGGDYA